jgi:hypothetical protein
MLSVEESCHPIGGSHVDHSVGVDAPAPLGTVQQVGDLRGCAEPATKAEPRPTARLGPPVGIKGAFGVARDGFATLDANGPALTGGKGEGDGTTPDRSSTDRQEADRAHRPPREPEPDRDLDPRRAGLAEAA